MLSGIFSHSAPISGNAAIFRGTRRAHLCAIAEVVRSRTGSPIPCRTARRRPVDARTLRADEAAACKERRGVGVFLPGERGLEANCEVHCEGCTRTCSA